MIKTLADEFDLNRKSKSLSSLGGSYNLGGIINNPFLGNNINIVRVSKEDLERVYLKNPIIRNSIRRKCQMIASAGYRIKYTDDEERKKFEEFFDNIGSIGDDCDFDQIYNGIPKSQFIFGGAWIELIWDEKDQEIVDLNRLDSRTMDYARTNKGDIVIDPNTQKPVGYTQKKAKNIYKDSNVMLGDNIPNGYEKVVDLKDKIFLLPKRVALIRFEEEGDGLEFWGLVETIYHDSLRKGKLEEAGFNSAFQRWMAPLIAYLGDDRHPPTPQLATQTLSTMKKMKHDLLSTFPYYVKLDTIKGNEMESYIQMLKSLRENEASGLQMPMPFAMSSGEATNRATLNNQQGLLEFGLNELAKTNATLITKRIFRPIAESMGLTTWPKLIANRVSVDEIEDRATRFKQYVDSGIFIAEEVREIIAKAEGITLDPNYKNINQNKKKEESKEDLDKKSDSLTDSD